MTSYWVRFQRASQYIGEFEEKNITQNYVNL